MRGEGMRMLAMPLAAILCIWLLAGLCMERLGVLQQQGSQVTQGLAVKVRLLQQLLNSSDAEEQAWRSLHSSPTPSAQAGARLELERQAEHIKRLQLQLQSQPAQDGDLLQSLQDTRLDYLKGWADKTASEAQLYGLRQAYFNSLHALLDGYARQLQRAEPVLQYEFWRACQFVLSGALGLSLCLIATYLWRWRSMQNRLVQPAVSDSLDAAQLAHLAIERARLRARRWTQSPNWSKRGEMGGV